MQQSRYNIMTATLAMTSDYLSSADSTERNIIYYIQSNIYIIIINF